MPSERSALAEKLYAAALRIRMVEDTIMELYPLREMRTPTHFCTGQEAISTGVCASLTKDDLLYAFYRSHGWYLAKGGNLDAMIAEFYGKATGCSKGFGGSMHLIDLAAGFTGTTAIVAGAMPHAVGAAFTLKARKTSHVAVSAFGDGATEEGLFQESLMFAQLRKLPVVFICENNGLATNTLIHERQPDVPIYKRAESMGVRSFLIDGNDAFAVHETASEAIARARKGEGPSFIECTTYRILEHCGPFEDYHLGHRSAADGEPWKKRDPILLLEKALANDTLKKQLQQRYKAEIDRAVELARKAPFPPSLLPEGLTCL